MNYWYFSLIIMKSLHSTKSYTGFQIITIFKLPRELRILRANMTDVWQLERQQKTIVVHLKECFNASKAGIRDSIDVPSPNKNPSRHSPRLDEFLSNSIDRDYSSKRSRKLKHAY